ncbi:hypothetical protein, partial [Arthrobacter sp. 9E06]|uniref:hypothetical protein n=1 Tax=Arthrobacter sp. 9E06 TaxID=2058890 RepID=UPI001CA55BB9
IPWEVVLLALQSVLIVFILVIRRLRMWLDFVVLSSTPQQKRPAGVPDEAGSARAPMGYDAKGSLRRTGLG